MRVASIFPMVVACAVALVRVRRTFVLWGGVFSFSVRGKSDEVVRGGLEGRAAVGAEHVLEGLVWLCVV